MNTRSIIIALATSLFVANGALALTETVNGIKWTYTVSNGKASVGGGGSSSSTAVSTSTTGAITIPSTLGGYPVTSIGDYAFWNCSGLTSVSIPNSVTRIGNWAFVGCGGLTSFVVGENNPNYSSVNGLLLSKDRKTLLCGVNGYVTIPDSVTSIEDSAFSGCGGLTSVTIGSSVTSIGSYAFNNCTNLTAVTIPDSVTSIEDSAFSGCGGLMSVSIPNSVKSIGNGAFYCCSGLTSVTIPESVTRIGEYAFLGCVALQNVTFKGIIPEIEPGAFEGCPYLTSARFEADFPPPEFYEMLITRFEVPVFLVDYVKAKTTADVVGIEVFNTGCIDIERDYFSPSLSAIRTECDLQVNVSFGELAIPKSETTVSLRIFAQDGGETVTNFTFNSAITNGAILAAVLRDFDFDGCAGYSVSVSNSLFSGTHDFGRQDLPEETVVVADTTVWESPGEYDEWMGSYSGGYDEWGYWHDKGYLQMTPSYGVMRVWYSSDYGYSDGEHQYEVGQPEEVGISFDREEDTYDDSTCEWNYRYDWTRYNLPEGAAGWLYTPTPAPTDPREEEEYPLYYYHTWPASDGGEQCCSSWETTLVIPPSIKTHWINLSLGDNLFIYIEGLGSYNSDDFMADEGDYFTSAFEGQLPYQTCQYRYDPLNGWGEYSGWGIPMDFADVFSSYRSRCLIVKDGYYIKRISRISSYDVWYANSYYDEQTGQYLYYDYDDYDYVNDCYRYYTWEKYLERKANAFIEYDREGNIIATQYGDYASGNPLSAFGPIMDDVTFSFSAAPIPYSITFVDELGAANTNATTYTIEDCYNFAPPAEVEGWEFLGWDIDGVFYETGDITVTAQWQRRDSQVTFVVGAHGSRTGGGELEQTVVWGEAAVSPEIAADCGWVFTGWDAEISRVTESMTVTALYERAPLSIREATGLDKAWTTGGDAEWFTEWTEDAHDGTNHLHSGAIGDGQESWIETVVTNTGVVSFWWKASSEAYRGIAYDTLVFTVDGEISESVPPIGGEVDWTNVTLVVEGDGPHALRWTYRKDASDSDGEDCAWLDDVQYLREVHVTFADGGATAGAAPDAITVGEGAEITLPGQSSLAWPKHRFIGWRTGDDVFAAGTAFALGYDDVAFTAEWEEKRVAAPSIEVAAWYDTERTTVSMFCETAGATIRYTLDGSAPTAASQAYTGPFSLAGSATVKAVAVLDDWFDSEVVSAVSVRAPWTPDECLNATGMVFRTGGDAEWVRDRAVAHDGDTAMRSGAIDDGQTSWIEVTVTGAGTLSFWWRASSESYKGTLYDLARLTVDGVSVIPDIGGEIGWRSESVSISGGGAHVVRWAYIKDSLNSSGEDCAWLDEVSWTPSVAREPLPELAQDALPGDVAAVMAETADASLSANVTNAVQYAAFRTWALAVTNDMVTAQAVKESSLAWLSFALGADALIVKELTTDDVRIESFTPASAGGNYEITVSVKDVDIGGGAVDEDVLKENLKKVLGIEGARTLAPDSFSSDNIDITFGTPVDGKARIIVSPPPDAGSTFFMRVKVK